MLAGGIIAIHSGVQPGDPPLRRTAAGDRGARRRRAAGCRRAWARSRSGCASWSAGHGEPLGEDAAATLAAGGKRLRPMLVLLCAGDGGGRAGRARRDRGRAGPHGDPGPRRRPRRRAAAPRPADRRRHARAATAAVGVGDLLFSRAFAAARRTAATRARSRCSADASVALARGELAQRQRRLRHSRSPRSATSSAAAEDREAVRVRLPARAAGLRRPRRPRSCASFGREIGLAFQLLDDVLDVTGPPERTGKARGTDLLDGTVTLPLILAARARPGTRDGRPARRSTPPGAEALCDRIAATGALDEVRGAGQGRDRAGQGRARLG